MGTKFQQYGYATKNWKSQTSIPHIQTLLITKKMMTGKYRLIDVRNNVGDAIRIKVDSKLKVIVNKL